MPSSTVSHALLLFQWYETLTINYNGGRYVVTVVRPLVMISLASQPYFSPCAHAPAPASLIIRACAHGEKYVWLARLGDDVEMHNRRSKESALAIDDSAIMHNP